MRKKERTVTNLDANEFDCDLYRLVARCERRAAESAPRDRKQWSQALILLRSARSHVRGMMHPDDLAETI